MPWRFLKAITIVIAVTVLAASADAQRFKFDRFTADSGIASSFVLQIEQDAQGNIWFVTLDGLSRFDGNEFTNFGTAEGMSDQRLSSLVITDDGRYLFGSASGISVWDGRIVRSYTESDGLGRGSVWAIATEPSGRAWVGTQAGGLSSLDGDRIRTYTKEDGLPSNFIYALRVDSKGRLWIGTRDAGLAMAEIGEDGVPAIRSRWSVEDGLTSPIVHAFFEEPEGTMLVGTRGGGMYRIDAAGDLRRVAPQLAKNDVYSIRSTESGGVLLGLLGAGVRICSPPGYEHCLTLDTSNGLTSNSVTAVLEDRERGLWIGTTSGALHLAGHDFVNYGTPEGLSSDYAFAIVPDRDDSLWISSLNGLTHLAVGDRTKALRTTTLTVENGLPTSEVWDVLRDRRNRLWIATSNGLCLYAEDRGCLTFGVEEGLPTRGILALFEDRDGRVWVATRNGVARLIDDVGRDTRKVVDLSALEGFEVTAIAQAKDGSIWFPGTSLLARWYDGTWTEWKVGAELGARTLTDVLAASDGSVWLSTNDQGVGRYDSTLEGSGAGILRLYGSESGLPSLSVKTLVEDDQGMIWAGSTAGLLKLDPTKAGTPGFVVRQFTLDDGLASQEPTSQHAFARDSKGDLWFGFSGGVTRYVNLDEFGPQEPRIEPVVTILSIQAGSAKVFSAPFTTMAASNGHHPRALVEPPLGERNVSVAYSAAVFRGRRTLQYEVRLDGYQNNWSTPTQRATKEYTKLPPGEYTFRVRARVGNGSWSQDAAVPIAIPALFWETIWFRALLAIAAVGVLVSLHKARTLGMSRRNEELAAIVADRTRALEERSHDLEETNIELEHANIELDTINRLLKDADLAKSRFLARMSHELRTPLNSIIGFTDLMMDNARTMEPDRRQRFLRNVKHSATILLGLINDILDISKIEAGKMEVHIERTSIREVAEEVVETMRVSADQKQSRILLEVDPAVPEVYVDTVKVRQILQNLISNAIKYSDDGATVSVSVSPVSVDQTGLGLDAFEIAVTDNGHGIPEEQLPGIFDEYRRVRENSTKGTGTGLGLAIVSKFAELQGGRVTAESELGSGSSFRVWLPIDARHWDSEQRSQ